MQKTTKQHLIKLRALAKQGGETIYERVTLARSVLADLDYLAEEHQGDELRCREYLTREFFHGWLDVNKLLMILDVFPLAEQWQARKYNLDRLYGETIASRKDAAKESTDKPKRASCTIAEMAEVRDELEHAEKRIEFMTRTVADKDGMIAGLQQRIRELEQENAELRGRIRELERVVSRDFASAGAA